MRTKANKAEQTGERIAFRGRTARQSVTGEVSHAAPGIEIQDPSSVAAHQPTLQDSIDTSPRQAAQAKQLSAVFGSPEQREEEEEELQLVAAPTAAQYDAGEEETPPQGRFDTVQREGTDEHGPPQGKLDSGQAVVQSQTGKVDGENPTGMPDRVKTGIERLSGMDLSDVRVQTDSPKPAQLNAHAYAQGNEIHLGPGQEKHLPHEAWHLVQQRQGRVQPTVQMAGVQVNDEEGLEREADLMGEEAVRAEAGSEKKDLTPVRPGNLGLRQQNILRLQRQIGNGAVQRCMNGALPVQRDEDEPAFSRQIVHEGHTLTDDPTRLQKVVEAVATEKGIAGVDRFAWRYFFRAATHSASGLPDLNSTEYHYWMSVSDKLDQAVRNLKVKAKKIVSEFERNGLNVISQMLNESELKLEAEKARYGLEYSAGMADSTGARGAPGGPLRGTDYYSVAHNTDTKGLSDAAQALQPLRAELDNLYTAREALEEQVFSHNAGPLPTFRITNQAEHDRLSQAISDKEPQYNRLCRQKAGKFPILAAFTTRGSAANLASIAAITAGTDVTVGPLIAKQLKNIGTVRAAVADGDLVIWDLASIVRGTQALLGYSPNTLGYRITQGVFKEKQKDKAIKQIALAVLQIGLGLLAAAVAGGNPSVGMAIARAAVGAASLTLSAAQAMHSLQEYQLASAMNGTDPDKARVISQDEPSLFWLALELVAVVADAYAARDAFVLLKGTVQNAIITGSVSAVGDDVSKVASGSAELAKLREAAAPYPGVYEKALKQIGRAEEDPARVTAAIAEEAQSRASAARASGMPVPPSVSGGKASLSFKDLFFAAKAKSANALLKQFQGEIPDIVRGWIADGRVRQLTEAKIRTDFGHLPGYKSSGPATTSYADDLITDGALNWGGFYYSPDNVVYIRSGSREQMAGMLIHEAGHKLRDIAERERLFAAGMSMEDAEKAARDALLNYESEMMAAIVERDFYLLTFGEGGPRAGQASKYGNEHMREMMSMSDGQLMGYVERNYASLNAAAAVSDYKQPGHVFNLDKYVEQILQDIALRREMGPPKK